MRPLADRRCSVDGCSGLHYARSWCQSHYERWMRNGDVTPRIVRHTGTDTERLLAKVKKTPGGCWEWQASRGQTGYGNFRFAGAMRHAHTVAYELFVGPVPAGKELDHLCRNRGCVNPEHLEPVTHLVNVQRGSRYIHGRYSKAPAHAH